MTKPRRRQAGEGAIFEYQTRAGLRYAIKWREQQEDGTERQVLRRTTRAGQPMTTRKQAAEELGSILVKIREGAYVTPSKITTGQWLAEWLKGLRVAPSTRSSYAKNIRLHLVPTLGQVPLARLTGAKIDGLYRDLERSGRQDHASGDGLSARTVRYIHTILKAALREAVAQGLLVSNPADKAHPPSAKEARPPEMHPWKAEQLATFLGWASEHGCADLMAWQVLAFSGARRGEVLALRWRDLDVERRKLSIRRSVGLVRTKGEGAKLVEGTTKTGKSRIVELDRRTVEALRRYRVARASLDLRLARDDALIFGTLEGGHRHPERFSRTFSEALARCVRDLGDETPPPIRVHDLRHGWATMALEAGVHPRVVQEQLGHTNISITLGIYSHVIEGLGEDAAEKVAAIAWGEA
jgi:integrase